MQCWTELDNDFPITRTSNGARRQVTYISVSSVYRTYVIQIMITGVLSIAYSWLAEGRRRCGSSSVIKPITDSFNSICLRPSPWSIHSRLVRPYLSQRSVEQRLSGKDRVIDITVSTSSHTRGADYCDRWSRASVSLSVTLLRCAKRLDGSRFSLKWRLVGRNIRHPHEFR